MAETTSPTGNLPVDAYKSLPILIIYLSVCAGLAIALSFNIYQRYTLRKHQATWQQNHRRQFGVFLLLSALSLGATWYHMFCFFAHSYRDWEAAQPDAQRVSLAAAPFLSRCELWLRDTKLFRQAWESVSESAERSWWSGQIFLWTVSWSVFLGVMGRRYTIRHVWAYMLLGQIVAISFAQNLFTATLLVSTPLNREKLPSWSPPLFLELAPAVISLVSGAVVPYVAHTGYFLYVLLIPHLLLFIPGLLSPSILPRGAGSNTRSMKTYGYAFAGLALGSGAILARMTYDVSQGQGIAAVAGRLLGVMHEHPAVSSVSWDVVFCLVNTVAWGSLRERFLVV